MSLKKINFPYYKVKEHENLKIVANKFGIDATQILLNNSITPKEIKEGIMLKIDT